MATLKTNYKDDILDTSVNTQRKYRMVNNADGTISLEDVTVYTQNGDTFGASEVNQIHAAVNMVNESLNVRYNEETDIVQIKFGGEWVDWKLAGLLWDGTLFDPNSQYVDYTGGWSITSGVTINTVGMYFSNPDSAGNTLAYAQTKKLVDITRFSKITAISNTNLALQIAFVGASGATVWDSGNMLFVSTEMNTYDISTCTESEVYIRVYGKGQKYLTNLKLEI